MGKGLWFKDWEAFAEWKRAQQQFKPLTDTCHGSTIFFASVYVTQGCKVDPFFWAQVYEGTFMTQVAENEKDSHPLMVILGCGFMGRMIQQQAKGWRTLGVKRSVQEDSPYPMMSLDLWKGDLRSLPKADLYVYALSPGHSSGDVPSYEVTYRETLKRLLDTVPVPRMVFVSSTSVYSEGNGGWVREGDATVESGPSKAIVEGEHLLAGAGVPYQVLRLGGLYGATRESFLRGILSGVIKEGPSQYTNRIHVEDAVRALFHTLTQPWNNIWNVVDEDPADRNEIIQWVREEWEHAKSFPPRSNEAHEEDKNGRIAWKNDTHEKPRHKRVSSGKLKQSGFTWLYPSYKEGYLRKLQEWSKERQRNS